MRGVLLFLHLLGMAFWLGGLFTLGIWTSRARRTGEAGVVTFAYATAGRVYRGVVAAGAWVTTLAGVGLVFTGPWAWFQPFPNHWLFQMQVLGILAFVVTVAYLVPGARKLGVLAERAAQGGEETDAFRSRVRRQAIVGSVVGGALVYLVLLGAIQF